MRIPASLYSNLLIALGRKYIRTEVFIKTAILSCAHSMSRIVICKNIASAGGI